MTTRPTPGDVMHRLSLYRRRGYLSRDAADWLRGWLASAMMRGLPAPRVALEPDGPLGSVLRLEWGSWTRGWWLALRALVEPPAYRFPAHFVCDNEHETGATHSAEFTLSPASAPRLAGLVQGVLS